MTRVLQSYEGLISETRVRKSEKVFHSAEKRGSTGTYRRLFFDYKVAKCLEFPSTITGKLERVSCLRKSIWTENTIQAFLQGPFKSHNGNLK
jgi:hypothetical protein